MFFFKENKALVGKYENEILRIEAWGKNALRVRCTQYPAFSGNDWALTEPEDISPEAVVSVESATIQNGTIRASVNPSGVISFYRGDKLVLREYSRSWGTDSKESRCLRVVAREFDPFKGGDYRLNVRFESNDNEKIFGMGQYQHAYLNLKGCILELAQRNSQVSVPFALSSLGYGFLWNNPAVGKVTFGKNYTEWHADVTDQMDY
jgi:alpha-D-xyloside xylohydrolase